MVFGEGVDAAAARALGERAVPCRVVEVVGSAGAHVAPGADEERGKEDRTVIVDREGLVTARYDGRPGTCYLIRPDQHVCARWRAFDAKSVAAALARACGNA